MFFFLLFVCFLSFFHFCFHSFFVIFPPHLKFYSLLLFLSLLPNRFYLFFSFSSIFIHSFFLILCICSLPFSFLFIPCNVEMIFIKCQPVFEKRIHLTNNSQEIQEQLLSQWLSFPFDIIFMGRFPPTPYFYVNSPNLHF